MVDPRGPVGGNVTRRDEDGLQYWNWIIAATWGCSKLRPATLAAISLDRDLDLPQADMLRFGFAKNCNDPEENTS